MLNEVLSFSQKRTVIEDNCNMALTVSAFLPRKVTPYPYAVVPCTRKPPRTEMSSPEAVLKLHSFASNLCIHQPSGSKCGDLTRVPLDAKSRELARAGCGCGCTTATCSHCSNEPAPLPVTFFGFHLPAFGFHQSQTDSLKSTNILCSSGLSFRNANKQRPCQDPDSVSDVDLCLLSCRSCHHLSLSCLSCRLCQSCPPPSDPRCSLPHLSRMRIDFNKLFQCNLGFHFETART